MTYGDVDLHMDQVPQPLLSDFTQARQLLYHKLMFGAQNLPRIQACALKDNPDADSFDWFWDQYHENADLLKGSAAALLTVIQASKPLRDSFLDRGAHLNESTFRSLFYNVSGERSRKLQFNNDGHIPSRRNNTYLNYVAA